MIKREMEIEGWKVEVFFCITHYDEAVLEDALEKVDAPTKVIRRMREIARENEYNTGFTYSNVDLQRSVMVVGKTTSSRELMNTFVHELRHLADDIAIGRDMALFGEQVAYLSGDIAARLSDIVGRMVCGKGLW